MSFASVACGADGLMIEVHVKPEEALSDASQTISPEQLIEIIEKLKKFTALMNRII